MINLTREQPDESDLDLSKQFFLNFDSFVLPSDLFFGSSVAESWVRFISIVLRHDYSEYEPTYVVFNPSSRENPFPRYGSTVFLTDAPSIFRNETSWSLGGGRSSGWKQIPTGKTFWPLKEDWLFCRLRPGLSVPERALPEWEADYGRKLYS